MQTFSAHSSASQWAKKDVLCFAMQTDVPGCVCIYANICVCTANVQQHGEKGEMWAKVHLETHVEDEMEMQAQPGRPKHV